MLVSSEQMMGGGAADWGRHDGACTWLWALGAELGLLVSCSLTSPDWALDRSGSSSFSGPGGPGEGKVLTRDLEERAEWGLKVWVRAAVKASPAGTPEELDPAARASGAQEDEVGCAASSRCKALCPPPSATPSREAESWRCPLPWRGSAVPFPLGVPDGAGPRQSGLGSGSCPVPS